jgi:hypothetical protein
MSILKILLLQNVSYRYVQRWNGARPFTTVLCKIFYISSPSAIFSVDW